MPMIPFYIKFPSLAPKETRSITVKGGTDLPDGEYGFIELYCDEVDCDCRRVVIDVMSPTTGAKTWATINYGWEEQGFYERWLGNKEDAVDCKGPSLDPINPQTEYSPVLLMMFEYLLEDEAYVERLKRHYYMFKGAIYEEYRTKKKQRDQKKRTRRRR